MNDRALWRKRKRVHGKRKGGECFKCRHYLYINKPAIKNSYCKLYEIALDYSSELYNAIRFPECLAASVLVERGEHNG